MIHVCFAYMCAHMYVCTTYMCITCIMTFPGSLTKNPPAKQETKVPSLGGEDPLEKEMAAHSSILAWEIPRPEEPRGLYSPWDRKKVRHNLATKQQSCINHIYR